MNTCDIDIENVDKFEFLNASKDTQFWRGNYGAKTAGSHFSFDLSCDHTAGSDPVDPRSNETPPRDRWSSASDSDHSHSLSDSEHAPDSAESNP